MKVGIVDYGVGNLGSVARALEELGTTPLLLDKASHAKQADKFILPGVGNFSECAERLEKQGWTSALGDEIISKEKQILGICLGMQLLASESTEGTEFIDAPPIRGLNFIPGQVKNLRDLGCKQRIPHMGWNSINIEISNHQMFDGIPSHTDFYFVHSYAFVPDNLLNVVATVNYGLPVTSAIHSRNIWGTQFHPEKSSRAGFKLLRNFIDFQLC
jgi:glutamine amidotransferase